MNKIARLFFHFDRFLRAQPIGAGNINDTYRLDFEVNGAQKTVLLQCLNHHVFKQPHAVMDNTLQVCKYLATQEYPYQIAEPLPGIDRQFFQIDEVGNFWRAFSFIPQSYAPDGVSDVVMAFEAARAYGAFARALKDFPASKLVETIPGFHDTNRRWEVFLKVLAEDPVQRAKVTHAEIEALFAA